MGRPSSSYVHEDRLVNSFGNIVYQRYVKVNNAAAVAGYSSSVKVKSLLELVNL